MEKYISIGYTKKTKGVKGDLKVEVDDIYVNDFLKATVIFLSQQGKEMPFFVEKITAVKELLLKLEDVNSKEQAYGLMSKEMFLRESDVTVTEEEVEVESDLVFGHLVNYKIKDEALGEIGDIIEVLELPQQEMAVVLFQEKEILIPLHEDLILEVDDDSRVVQMDLPEGITEL